MLPLRRRASRGPRLLGALLLAATALPADAGAEWYLRSSIGQNLGYDDNIDLDGTDQDGGLTATTSLGGTLGTRTPTLDLSLAGRVDYTAYALTDRSAGHNEEIALDSVRFASPRTRFGLSAGARRDTSQQDVLEDTGGRRRNDEPLYTVTLTPFAVHQLTPLDSLNASASWRRRLATGEGDEDFTTLSGNLGWRRTMTRRSTLGLELYGNRIDASNQQSVIVSPRLYLGYRYEERLDLSLSLGPSVSWTETDQSGGSGGTRYGVTVDGALAAQLTPTTTATVALSHYLEPAGTTGDVSETSRISLGLGQQLTRRLRLDAGGLAQRQTSVTTGSGGDRDFLQASAGLSYALSERLDLGASYRLRHEQGDDDATSNAVFVSVSYRLPEYRW
jgi:opacity protein-like surface antigen